MKLSDGLFLDCFRNVSTDYPEIEADDKIVDNACMQLVMRPAQFDIMLLENLYGDIVSDLCAGFGWRPGSVPGANIGETGCRVRSCARFRAGYRRTGNRQPDCVAAVRNSDAAPHRGKERRLQE